MFYRLRKISKTQNVQNLYLKLVQIDRKTYKVFKLVRIELMIRVFDCKTKILSEWSTSIFKRVYKLNEIDLMNQNVMCIENLNLDYFYDIIQRETVSCNL